MRKKSKQKNNTFLKIPLNTLDTVRGRVSTALAAAFAFVIALSWNDTIKKGVNNLIEAAGVSGETYIYSMLTALFVTIIGISGIYLASKLTIKKNR